MKQKLSSSKTLEIEEKNIDKNYKKYVATKELKKANANKVIHYEYLDNPKKK